MARSTRRRRGGLPIERARVGRIPFVAIVGRPNVGKSTLFNRLARSRLAIVDDTPGVTRDRIYAEVDLRGRPVGLIDTGGIEAPGGSDAIVQRIRHQVGVAVGEADVVICLFDAKAEPTSDDAAVVDLLRRGGCAVIWAANKADGPSDAPGAAEYHSLGIDDLLLLSAAGGTGVGDLVDAVIARLPGDVAADESVEEEPLSAEMPDADHPASDAAPPLPRVAIIGRPNVGKSTLANRLLGEDRMLVDDRPGTTRDAVDALAETERGPIVLIDTAGLRKRPKVATRIERLSALSAVRAIERCHVAVLIVDPTDGGGGGDQDRHLAGLAAARGRAMVLAVNKVDLFRGAPALRELDRGIREAFAFVAWAPIVFLSARSGRGVPELLDAVLGAHGAANRRAGTGELNRFLDALVERHSPPLWRNKPVVFYYAAQVAVRPPTFTFFVNRPDGVHPSYRRYIENQLRERFDLAGCPVRIRYRRGRP